MSRPSQHDLDMKVLIASQPFRRFLLQIAKDAGIWIPTSGADHSLPYREGHRSLGLEILRKAAAGTRGGTIEHVLALILSEANPQEAQHEEPDSLSRN